jgi:hypothetical protein
MKIRVIELKEQIKSIPSRWKAQYWKAQYWKGNNIGWTYGGKSIYYKLLNLYNAYNNHSLVPKEKIDEIIGKDSWTKGRS